MSRLKQPSDDERATWPASGSDSRPQAQSFVRYSASAQGRTSPDSQLPSDDLRVALQETLASRIHGLCFSPYLDGQKRGAQISEAQIRERMKIIQPYTRWVRSFSCTDGNEMIPPIAHEFGLKTLVGEWLGTDDEINQREMRAAINLARAGHVDVLAVGNEVLLREDLTESQRLAFILEAKAALPTTQVGYVDAYYLFEKHLLITAQCDLILTNCYPFWEGCPRESAIAYMQSMVSRVQAVAAGTHMIEYVRLVKQRVVQPITFCENYVPWQHKLRDLVAELDFISLHTYPVWEYKQIHEALAYTKENVASVARLYPDKPLVITEAGWATNSNGRGIQPEHSSQELQAIYYGDLLGWTRKAGILCFVYEAFDEPWKGSPDPMEPEKHWGLFTADRRPKLAMQDVYPELVTPH